MTLLVLEKVSPSLRGECTRYLIQVGTGVFIGTLNAIVREKLWETVKQKSEGGNCLLAYSTNNEQGFSMETFGNPRRTVIDFDGLQLIKIQS